MMNADLLIVLTIAFLTALLTWVAYRLSLKRSLQYLFFVGKKVAEGDIANKVYYMRSGLFKQLVESLNQIVDNLTKAADFAKQIGQGNLDVPFHPAGPRDVLGMELTNMRNQLRTLHNSEKSRSWVTTGMAHFVDILRTNNHDIQSLSKRIIFELVSYVQAVQGGIFTIKTSENDEQVELEMTACYAYGHQKQIEKIVKPGEGLIGQVYLSQKTLQLDNIPSDYPKITSGLGDALPNHLLIVPLKLGDQVEGVIELASFSPFKDHEVEFVNRLGESIAATLLAVRNVEKTSMLLLHSREQAEKMRIHEMEIKAASQKLAESEQETRRQNDRIQQMLSEVKNHEARLMTLVNNTDEIIVAIDHTYRLVIFNDSFKFLFTIDKKAPLIGNSIGDFLDAKFFEEMQHDCEKVRLGRKLKIERKIVTREGMCIFEINYSPVRDHEGKVNGITLFMKDISEFIRKNEKIRRSQEETMQQSRQLDHVREAMNRSGIISVEYDMDGYILDANTAFLRIMGYRQLDEVVGMSHDIFVSSDHAETEEYRSFMERLKSGQSVKGQFERVTKSGQTIWLSGSYNVVNEINGRPIMIVQVVVDITESVMLLKKTIDQSKKLQEAERQVSLKLHQVEAEQKKNRAILQGCVDGVISFDDRGHIEFLNLAAEDMLGVRELDMLGKKISQVLPLKLHKSPNDDYHAMILSNGEEKEIFVRTEATFETPAKEEIDVLMTLTKASLGKNNISFTLFMQKISVELF